MSASPNTPVQSAELQQLVARIAAEVMQRLSGEASQVIKAAVPSDRQPVSVADRSAPDAPAGSHMSVERTVIEKVLPEKVIVLATVSKLPRTVREVTVRSDAVLTPSAREWLADQKMAWRRAAKIGAAASAPPAPPAFLLAACDLPARSAAQAAAVARAVPGGQQLPTTGLASLIDALAEAATRSGSRGMLLSPRPEAAALIANRKRAIRAVAATSVREGLAVAQECRATLMVVDPSRLGPGGLKRLAVEFAKQTHQPLPADLAEACRPCGCSRPSQEASR